MNYKLKRDLPDVKAGATFNLAEELGGYFYGATYYPKSIVENTPEWFEPETDSLESIIEDKYSDLQLTSMFNPLVISQAKIRTKEVAEKYLSLKKEEMIKMINDSRVSGCSGEYYLGINKAIAIIKEA